MFLSRILSRISRSEGLRSSLSTAVVLPLRSQTSIFPSQFHSLAHNFSPKVLATKVSMDSFAFQTFSFSSSTSSPESDEKKSNTEASKTSDEKATSEANEAGLDSESKASTTDSAQTRRKGAKRAAFSESDSTSDDDDELSMDDLVKLVAEKEDLLSEKEDEIKKMKDKVLRTYAEMENVMDRTRRDAENTKKYAIQNFAKSLLDVADNLGRASSVVKESFSKLDTSTDSAGATPLLKTLLEGVEMTEKQLAEVFKKFGMEKYDPINEPFDPNRHNAVFQVPDASKPEGTVAHVLKSGYMLYDRVIRPAEVGVTHGGENQEDEKKSDA